MKKSDGSLRASLLTANKLNEPTSRREFLKTAVITAVATAVACHTNPVEAFSFDEYFQKHYTKLTPEDKKKVFARIEAQTKEMYGAVVKVGDPQPIANTKFVFGLNLNKCDGNRLCVEACQKENNTDRSMAYIRVLEMDRGTFNLEKSDPYYEGEIPKPGKFYLPVQCQQCENSPCTRACPISATWKQEDGVVVVDYDWCIGCRYCQAACPYEARHYNWHTPKIAAEEINPNVAYLSNRIRPRGVVEKCTFCLHRTREGRYPACLEACPTGARKFGNVLDPESEVYYILKHKNIFVLKEELNTVPQFFYYFG